MKAEHAETFGSECHVGDLSPTISADSRSGEIDFHTFFNTLSPSYFAVSV